MSKNSLMFCSVVEGGLIKKKPSTITPKELDFISNRGPVWFDENGRKMSK